MQIQKEEIKRKILEVAKEEFFEKGFKATSMRTIADKADVVLSNIYNYFKSKDEILKEVLKPLFDAFERLNRNHNREDYIDINIFTSEEYQQENVALFVDLIMKYKKELKLLLFHSYGSSLEGFWAGFTDKHTIRGMEYMRRMKEKYPEININISEFFIHTMSSWFLTIIAEIVSHDLNRDQIERFYTEYISFGTAGWKKVMDVKI